VWSLFLKWGIGKQNQFNSILTQRETCDCTHLPVIFESRPEHIECDGNQSSVLRLVVHEIGNADLHHRPSTSRSRRFAEKPGLHHIRILYHYSSHPQRQSHRHFGGNMNWRSREGAGGKKIVSSHDSPQRMKWIRCPNCYTRNNNEQWFIMIWILRRRRLAITTAGRSATWTRVKSDRER